MAQESSMDDGVVYENRWKILRQHWRFALWALWTSMGSMMLGLDNIVGGQILALNAFQKQYGVPYVGAQTGYLVPASWQSYWAAASQAGDFVGAICASYLLEKIGRKPNVLISAILTSVGVGLQIASVEWKLYLVGRLINGVAIGIMFTLSPLWIGEVARPELRGFFLCFYNSSIVFGQFLLVIISRGTEQVPGKWSYYSLMVLQFVFPAFQLGFYWWFPESPYWLINHDKGRERAEASFRGIYGHKVDPAFVEIEYERISANVAFNRSLEAAASVGGPLLYQCFRGTNRIRTLTSIFAAASQILIGASFVLGYLTYFLQLINVQNEFTVSAILFVVMLLSTSSAFPMVEIVGRRKLIIPGCFILTFFLFIIGIMGCISNKTAAGWVIVVCTFIWGLVYQCTVGACCYVVASELSSLPLRSSTQSLITMTNAVVGWIFLFTIPYMINPDAGNLGGKVGFIFGGFGIICSIVAYFYIPETKSLSFDDLDWLYTHNVPPRKFGPKMVRREEIAEAVVRVDPKLAGAIHLEDVPTKMDA